MKLIIDIPEEVIKSVKDTKTIDTTDFNIVSLYRAVKNSKSCENKVIKITKEEIRDKMFFINEENSVQPIAVIRVSDLLEKEVKKNEQN